MRQTAVFAALAAMLLATGLAPQPAQAQTGPNGEVLFRQRCQACHSVTASKPSAAGPNLYGVVDRKAAASPVPYKYSEALKKSAIQWTRPELDAYLAAPTKKVPGTKMVIALPNAEQRKAIIEYLARAK